MRKALGLGLLLGALLLAGCGQDTVKPSVTITAPQNGATVNQDTLTVQGTAQDNVRVNRVTYQLNNGQEQEVPINPGNLRQLRLHPHPPTRPKHHHRPRLRPLRQQGNR